MNRSSLLDGYRAIRKTTENLCEPLCIEDYVIQSMPDVSPPKWHLGHTSWFFERVILEQHDPSPKPFHQRYSFISGLATKASVKSCGAFKPRSADSRPYPLRRVVFTSSHG